MRRTADGCDRSIADLGGQERLAVGADELVAPAHQVKQRGKSQPHRKPVRRQAQQLGKTWIEQHEGARRGEHGQPDPQCRQSGRHPRQRAFGLVAGGDQRRRFDRADHVPAVRQRLAPQVVAAAIVVAPTQPPRA